MPLMSNVRPRMKPTDSVAAFEEIAEAAGLSLLDVEPGVGVEQMLSFFEGTQAEGCTAPSQDMLLFEWGTYNWGQGASFELAMSRQFNETGAQGEPEISQLRLVFKYAPNARLSALGEGNHWCNSRAELSKFAQFIRANPAFRALAEQKSSCVRLSHSYV
jgi:hypothetical protein